MQLRFSKLIKKQIITIELETINFTPQENKLLDEFGEPLLTISKTYLAKYPVNIDKKIRTGFKVRVKFDGTEDVNTAADAANAFFEEVQEKMSLLMQDLADKASDTELTTESGIISIKY